MEINAYTSPIYKADRFTDNSKTNGDSSLGIDDFLKLLSAQLANQDMMNPSSDTEFIAQLAQFSSLQAMDSIAKMTNLNQSTALVGKKVIVATYDKNNNLITDEGIVERVTLHGSSTKIIVNGKEYEYANVMEILNVVEEPTIKPEESESTNGTGNTGSTENKENNTK